MTLGTRLAQDVAGAAKGVGRLIRYDPLWHEGFEATAPGFVRSFLGPLLGLPFALIVAVLLTAAGREAGVDTRLVWAQGASYAFNALAYPALIALLARPVGIGAGYALFIIVTNWASLYLYMALAAAALLAPLGAGGAFVYTVLSLAILGLSLFITWRAAREALTAEIAPAVLVVVLSVAVLAAADQIGLWLMGAAR